MGGVITPVPRTAAAGEHELANLISTKGSHSLLSFHSVRAGRTEIDAVIVDRARGWIYVVEVKNWGPEWHPADDKHWVNDREKIGGTAPSE